jgi:hypothetical protein
MARRLFTLLSALSLLLCAAVCVLWVRSYWVRDSVGWLPRHDRFGLVYAGLFSEAGALEVNRVALTFPGGLPDDPAERMGEIFEMGWRSEPAEGDALWRENLMPRSEVSSGSFAGHGAIPAEWRSTRIPYWPAALATLILPLWSAARSMRARRRRRRNQCARCSYDLRATPGRCPECGAVPVTKEA